MAKIDFNQLYYQDPYMRELEVTVTGCEAVSAEDGTARYNLVFDKTIFYPEGGGQPGDRGWIHAPTERGEPLATILDTHYDAEGRIVHLSTAALEIGQIVRSVIDWPRRYELMQQHSAEHLISGLIKQRYGFENVGFHINEDFTTLDTSDYLPEGALEWLTEEMNRIIWANLPFETTVRPADEVKDVDYRSKIDLPDDVRLVKVEGVDLCACAGTHVHRTGELGQVRLIDSEKHRGGHRLTMLSGVRALRDAEALHSQAQALGAALAAPRLDLFPALTKLEEQLEASKEENRRLTNRLFDLVLPEVIDVPTLCVIPANLNGKDIKYQVKNLNVADNGQVLFIQPDLPRAKFFLRAQSKEDQQKVLTLLKDEYGAKGGGPPQLSQGALELPDGDLEVLLEAFRQNNWKVLEI